MLRLDKLNVQAQALQLPDQDVEGFRQTRREHRVALHDGLVDLRAAVHVVGLRGQELLEDVRRAVRLERPHLHLPEPLAAELRLPAQRLLGDERVRTDRAGVDLVVDEVGELEHVDVAHGDLLLEGLACHAVDQLALSRRQQVGAQRVALLLADVGLLHVRLNLLLLRPVEDRRREVAAQDLGRPAEMGLEDLTHVHARRHAERVEDDLHRRPVREVRHVLVGQDAGDDALVAVAAGHLVADGQLALHRHEHLDELDHAGGQLVAALQAALLLREERLQDLDLALRLVHDLGQLGLGFLVVLAPDAQLQDVGMAQLGEDVAGQVLALPDDLLAAGVDQVAGGDLSLEQVLDPLVALVLEDADLVLEVLLHHEQLGVLDLPGPLVLLHALAREDLHVDDDALDAGRAHQRRVADVARLLAEDRPQELLFGRELRLALGRDLADQDVARPHARPDPDDAALIEVVEERLAHVGDVAGHLLGAELGVAGLDLELLDVDGGVHVVLDQALADQDRVLEVVAAPGHERDEHVAAEGQLAHVGARAVAEDLPLADVLADLHDGLLVDAGVLVRALELRQVVDVGPDLLALVRPVLGLHADDDPAAVDRVHDAGPAAHHRRPGVLDRDVLHAGADERRFAAQQGHGLALHVGAHQRAVGVVVLEEGNERGRHRDELLGADVDVVHLRALGEDEVAGLAGRHAVLHDRALVVELDVGLGDRVLVLLPRREVEAVRLHLGQLLLLALEGVVDLEQIVALDLVAHREVAVAGLDDLHEVEDPALLLLAVRALDEPELVDAGEAAQRRDEADVRAFRRLDRADASVVGGVHVAHLEPGPLAAEAARPEGREPPLVGDLAERVRLVHELAELAGPEELADGGHDRLGVDEVVGHGRGHLLVDAHLLLDGALHPDEADAELVLEQLADAADPAIAEMVDVVHVLRAPAELQQERDHGGG